ncbi:MAG: hypothetical protein IH843_03715, partial [Thaumarchaeota archaeon]|nr:hypothetical protein [Nitrososphaerota archaeon]
MAYIKFSAASGRLALFLALACLLLWRGVAGAGLIPLEDKFRFERSLEEKVERVLDAMLGENQAKVSVRATLDLRKLETVT